MLFYSKERGQGATEFLVIIVVLVIIFLAVIKTVAPDKFNNLMSKF